MFFMVTSITLSNFLSKKKEQSEIHFFTVFFSNFICISGYRIKLQYRWDTFQIFFMVTSITFLNFLRHKKETIRTSFSWIFLIFIWIETWRIHFQYPLDTSEIFFIVTSITFLNLSWKKRNNKNFLFYGFFKIWSQ